MEIVRFVFAFFFVCCLYYRVDGDQVENTEPAKTFSAPSAVSNVATPEVVPSDQAVTKDANTNSIKDETHVSENNNGTTVKPEPDNKTTDRAKTEPSKATDAPKPAENSTLVPSSTVTTPVTPGTNTDTTTKSSTAVPPSNTTTETPPTSSTVAPTPTKEPPLPNSTEHPITPPSSSPKSRFDGPSFVGGIVLTVGLVAMGFIGFKYYKTRTDSYHTL